MYLFTIKFANNYIAFSSKTIFLPEVVFSFPKVLISFILSCCAIVLIRSGKWKGGGKTNRVKIRDEEVIRRKYLESKIIFLNQELEDSQRLAKLGSWEWHVDAPYIKCTEEYKRIFGFISRDIRLNDICSLIYKDDVDMFKAAIEKLMRLGEPIYMEIRIVSCDGLFKILHAYLKMVCNEEGTPYKLCGIVQDITKNRKTEDLLMLKALQLERSEKDLQQFVTVASHDLNEPLRKLKTYSGLLRNEFVGSFGERGKLFIDTIKNSACRLNNLIEDLTALSKVGIKKAVFEEIDLNEILNRISTAIKNSYGLSVKITIDKMPVLMVVAEQMALLFQELIHNAIKFRKKNCIAEIHISYAFCTNKNLLHDDFRYKSAFCVNYCQIMVRDNGIGFDQKYSDKIFSVFQQLHPAGKYDGTGIGLAICKKIAENHSGYISAKSEIDNGTTFTISLPYMKYASMLK